LSFINYRLIPDTLNGLPGTFGLNFELAQLSFGIFGFLLVIMMVLRPQGLLPERRREMELEEHIGADEQFVQVQARASGNDFVVACANFVRGGRRRHDRAATTSSLLARTSFAGGGDGMTERQRLRRC